MRKELEDIELEQVVGGTIFLSKAKMKVGFETTGEIFNLKNCTYMDALILIDAMHTQYTNSGKTDVEYEADVKNTMIAKGWI